jgi:hypothetical protein
MREHEPPAEVPAAAPSESDAVEAPASAIHARGADLHGLVWVPSYVDDYPDRDPLHIAEALRDGIIHLVASLANVEELKKRDPADDEHARQDATSVDAPAEIIPMHPIEQSEASTALHQENDRRSVDIERPAGAESLLRDDRRNRPSSR